MLNRQSGMSLLEILAAISVGTMLFIGLTDMINVSLEDARGQQAAYHQAQMVAAAQKYIAANYGDLQSDVASGKVVSAPMTELAKFLPNGFMDRNSYLHSTCVLIRKGSTPERLDALVVGYGGVQIPDRSIAAVAMNAGQGAGYILSSNTKFARGPSWGLDTTLYKFGTCLTGGASDAGHLVSNIAYEGPGEVLTDFLYRDPVPGHEELNRMNVPLQMAGTALVTVGTKCTQTALAIESTTKDVVVCDGGKWRYGSSSSSWKDPVANYAALATVPKKDGDVRVTLDTGRAFVYDKNADYWCALAVDENGDLYVDRDVVASRDLWADGNIQGGQDLTVARDIKASRDLTVSRNIDANGSVDIAQNLVIGKTLTARGYIDAKGDVGVAGNVRSAKEVRGSWVAASVYIIDGSANPGDACNIPDIGPDGTQIFIRPVGTLIRDRNGLLLNCASDRTFRYANGTYSP